jgi:putative cell wall-binding protein
MTQKIKKSVNERLVKSYVTTIIGVAIIVYAGWQYHDGKSMEEVMKIGGYGLIFLRSKDSLIGIPSGGEEK